MSIAAKMKVGDVFKTINYGDVEVVSDIDNRSVWVRFIDTGFKVFANTDNVRSGKVKDVTKPLISGVGFMGDGKYKPTKNRVINSNYSIWIGMINRCYDKNCKAYEIYGSRGVTVHHDWHNFQNFAKWYDENHPNDGERYELDKDIKFDGNKVYGPDTCIFATPKENQNKAHLKTHYFISPNGDRVEVSNLPEFCNKNGLCKFGMAKLSRGAIKSYKKWGSYSTCTGGAK